MMGSQTSTLITYVIVYCNRDRPILNYHNNLTVNPEKKQMLILSIFYIVLRAVSLQNFVLLNDCIVAHVLHINH